MRIRAYVLAVAAMGIACFMALCAARADDPQEPIWGNAFQGIAISVAPAKSQYTLQ